MDTGRINGDMYFVALYLMGLCKDDIPLPNTIPPIVMDTLLRWRDESLVPVDHSTTAQPTAPPNPQTPTTVSL